jgi:ribosomal-protein-alanine N-acetyltransferase
MTVPAWRGDLPIFAGREATVRELRPSDAGSLLAFLTTDAVTRLISEPPSTLEGFERFIAWTKRQRAAGSSISFGIVPRGESAAVGVIQVRTLDANWNVAEWGFALGSPYWGTGVFVAAAKAALDFLFSELRVDRLEARTALDNGRGIGVLRKLGAAEEGLLRQSLRLRSGYVDQTLWTLFSPTADARVSGSRCVRPVSARVRAGM